MRRFTISTFVLLTVLLVSYPALSQDVVTTAIGGGPNGIPAIDANLYNPYGVAVDISGNVYIASYNQHRVFKVNISTGVISVVAGSGATGYAGDGVTGGASNASLNHPFAVAVDTTGNVYIADQSNCVIRKVDTANTITTIAGTAGSCGYSGDGGKGTSAQLYYPDGLGLDSNGNLFIGDQNNCDVRRLILATDTISTYAGNHTCGYSGDGGAATSAELSSVGGVAADSSGNLFIADYGNCVIREVIKATQKISTVAGNHTCGYTGDGGPATSAQMNQVFGIAVNGTAITISDYYNERIRQFTVGGNINTVAGNGTACSGTCGAGGPATGVVLNYPYEIADDSSGNVYIADSHDYMVRENVKSSGLVNFFAGNGTYGYSGDGGPATSAELTSTYGVAKDSLGNVYIADTNNCLIRKVNTAGVISTFAGLVVGGASPRCGYTGDGGAATGAELNQPYNVA